MARHQHQQSNQNPELLVADAGADGKVEDAVSSYIPAEATSHREKGGLISEGKQMETGKTCT